MIDTCGEYRRGEIAPGRGSEDDSGIGFDIISYGRVLVDPVGDESIERRID